jgi:cysteine desulfurase
MVWLHDVLAKCAVLRQATNMIEDIDPSKTTRIYLDYAASAPVHEKALAAFIAATACFGNPSSPHLEGQKASAILVDARTRIAHLAGVKPRNLIFTSGATESNTIAIKGFIEQYKKSNSPQQDAPQKPFHILYLETAHSSTVKTVAHVIETNAKSSASIIPLRDGLIDLVLLQSMITKETVLVVVDAICGESGTRFDVRGVRKVLDEACVRVGIGHIQMHVDASQLPLVESFDRLRLAADTVTLDAQKVGGVRGIGALIVGDVTRLTSVMKGGGQEEGLRPGTEPVALAAAFAAALHVAAEEREDFVTRAERARQEVRESILVAEIPGIPYDTKNHAPHILNVSYPGLDTDYLIALLDAKGYAVSTKSACETDSDGSRAIQLLTKDESRAASTVRISWGPRTTNEELKQFAKQLHESVNTLKKLNISFNSVAERTNSAL